MASLIILDTIDKLALDPNHADSLIRGPVASLLSPECRRQAITTTAANRYNTTMRRLRQPKLQKSVYEEVSQTHEADWRTRPTYPRACGVWENRIGEFRLRDHSPIAACPSLLDTIHQNGRKTPSRLADLAISKIQSWDRMCPFRTFQWRCGRRPGSGRPSETTTTHKTGKTLENVEELLNKSKARNFNGARIARGRKSLARRLAVPEEYTKWTPANNTTWILGAPAPALLISEFLQKRQELNILRATQGPPRSAFSGIRRYANFRASRKRPCIRPTDGTVKEWGASSTPGHSFQMYLRLIQKAAFIPGRPSTWMTPAIKSIAAGVGNSQGGSFILP